MNPINYTKDVHIIGEIHVLKFVNIEFRRDKSLNIIFVRKV